jgi:metallophosphoesterase superfamily enzyme
MNWRRRTQRIIEGEGSKLVVVEGDVDNKSKIDDEKENKEDCVCWFFVNTKA